MGLGLITLMIGVTMAIGTKNMLIPLFSVLIGGMLGELLRIEDALERFGQVERGSAGPLTRW